MSRYEKTPSRFVYERSVWFYETDAMGVVHHSNYIRYCEEARIDWIRQRQISEEHYPNADMTLAVIETRTQHLRPAFFNDLLKIELQVKREKLKIYFRYAISVEKENAPPQSPICVVDVVLVPIAKDFKVKRLSKRFCDELEKEVWIETWPLNL